MEVFVSQYDVVHLQQTTMFENIVTCLVEEKLVPLTVYTKMKATMLCAL